MYLIIFCIKIFQFDNYPFRGLIAYQSEVALLKLIGNWKYAKLKFHILKITSHVEDSTIQVRWRISGQSSFNVSFPYDYVHNFIEFV